VRPRSPSQRAGAQSIHRASQILRVVASFSGRGASLAEAASASGLQKATVHRMLRALCAEGLAEQDDLTRNYRLGIGVFALSAAMGERFDIRAIAQASMERICADTEDTVYLAIRSGYDGLCLALMEGSYPEKTLKLSVHDRWPLGVGAFSMPLLAWLADNEVRAIVEHNAPRLAGQDLYTPEKILQRVQLARERRYAVNTIDSYPTMCAVGVPVLDSHRRPIASLCVTAIISRMPPERQKRIADLLWRESKKISDAWQGLRSVAAQADSWRAIAPPRAPQSNPVALETPAP
jgi:DNA-binding IclR family transcriptional regulator